MEAPTDKPKQQEELEADMGFPEEPQSKVDLGIKNDKEKSRISHYFSIYFQQTLQF